MVWSTLSHLHPEHHFWEQLPLLLPKEERKGEVAKMTNRQEKQIHPAIMMNIKVTKYKYSFIILVMLLSEAAWAVESGTKSLI